MGNIIRASASYNLLSNQNEPIMLKTNFQTELIPPASVKRGHTGADVRRVQEWLCLNAPFFPTVALAVKIDNDFGPATEQAVKRFQERAQLSPTGVVTPAVFNRLTRPLSAAFTMAEPQPGQSVRELIVAVAARHRSQFAAELQTSTRTTNLGPWVRSYCEGLEGPDILWCMGFAQAILDQAASAVGRVFTSLMPRSLSCDVVARAGQDNGRLLNSTAVRQNPARVRPGDLFLLRRTVQGQPDWFHTGIITAVGDGVFSTVEGNTNQTGSPNGTAVFARVRNFRQQTLDVFSVEDL